MIARIVKQRGFKLLGVRLLPTDNKELGQSALATEPYVLQVKTLCVYLFLFWGSDWFVGTTAVLRCAKVCMQAVAKAKAKAKAPFIHSINTRYTRTPRTPDVRGARREAGGALGAGLRPRDVPRAQAHRGGGGAWLRGSFLVF